MKKLIFVLFFCSTKISYADLQSEFQRRLEEKNSKKTTPPEKIKNALKIIEKKIGSIVEESENVQADPYKISTDSRKFVFYIDQLIFVKFKNQTICRGQIETFQDQPTYQGLRVICIDKEKKIKTFEDTL